ncbi:MAG TPA: hypothetical protein DCY53_01085 [Desulfobacteraceae bacterium]|nr:hypothetical protein [Desulfobacteraceae bacterium]
MTHSTSRIFIPLPTMILVINLFCFLPISYSAAMQNEQNSSGSDGISIYQIAPDRRGGKAYKLVYLVEVQMDVFWGFKTDFDNNFLVENKYIQEHHFIARNGNEVITEDKYTNGPDVVFRWQTTVFPQAKRLDFVLLNPEQCRQKFHYGYIQLKSVPEGTQVTQVAYFDFLGSSLWANYPWGGGMKDFLSYTAHWEQKTILNLKNRYHDKNFK